MTDTTKPKRGHNKGADLGGIRTVEDLRLRCAIDDVTGCWLWRGAISDGAPKVHFRHPVSLERTDAKGRRVALILSRGEDLPRGHVAWQRVCCDSPLCVNPEHCRSGPKKEWGRWLTASGKVKNLPSKCVAARKGWDTKGRKFTPEMRQQIMADSRPVTTIAAELGVSRMGVWSVRQQLSHRDGMANSSVWTFRP